MQLTLKPATTADLPLLQLWRKDPAVRAMSRLQHEFDAEATRRWVFEGGRRLYLAWDDGRPLGFVSLEQRRQGPECEVSIAVAPEMRGLGMGSKILAMADKVASGAPLVAQVRIENIASLATFRVVGYVETSRDDSYVYFRKE